MVTIIVLLILAGISIMMITGNNGILSRAGYAKKEMDIVTVKEQAEMIKGGAYITKKYENKELTKKDLLTEIANDKYFEGSIKLNDKIITANARYKIDIDDNLNITVSEFKNEVDIEYSVENLEYGARIIITPKFKNREPIITFEEYKTETLNNIQTDDDLKNIYLKYVLVASGREVSWEQMCGNQSFLEAMSFETVDDAKDFLENYEIIRGKTIFEYLYDNLYNSEYIGEVFLNGEKKEMHINDSSISYFINKNQKYTIYVNTHDGDEGYIIANITDINKILTVKNAICEFNLNDLKNEIYILTKDNKYLKIDNPEWHENTSLCGIGGTSNIEVLATDIEDFTYSERPYLYPEKFFIINNNAEAYSIDNRDIEGTKEKINDNILKMQAIDKYSPGSSGSYFKEIYYIYSDKPNEIYTTDGTIIADNVKDFFVNQNLPYYITNNNDLYEINLNITRVNSHAYTESLTTHIGSNVKEFNSRHYLNMDNELYKKGKSEKIIDNVKDIGCGLYITNSNKVYRIPYTINDDNYSEEVDIEIKELNRDFLITENNLIYVDSMLKRDA